MVRSPIPTGYSAQESAVHAVQADGMAIRSSAVSPFKGDREVVLEATKQNFAALMYADHTLRANKEFMFGIVGELNGLALQFASDALRDDRDFVLTSATHGALPSTRCTAALILVHRVWHRC